jgi:acyl CoA:acetate/3-ketoacid CoA transferase
MRPISNTPVKAFALVTQCQITWHSVIKNGCRVDYIVVMGPLFCGCMIQSEVQPTVDQSAFQFAKIPSELRKILADRIATEMKNENLAGLVKPQIIEGSLGPKARPMVAVSLPLAKRYMLEA